MRKYWIYLATLVHFDHSRINIGFNFWKSQCGGGMFRRNL